MPMRRYEVRTEYALGDPELYKSADKDDPEALLEGVAMSGLVGLLRQLGDLAEFAAEIFHDLHEEVMATAARGHDLMARVQQLEAEVPSIEKAFLSQTNHSPFFNNPGIEWRANLHMEHNLITRGDLPRFVMDSYEECRGPPRLFLLDKFDVAGAGACLKRYTDPSFFKVEAASSEFSAIETQREKKVRKAKKKASRWRNGQTPEVAPASHPKLQQLFLEERVENGHSDPARLVKLKRRHLNGSQFDVNSGRSYMEKFAVTPSPENKMVCAEDSVPSPLRLTFDNPGESGLDIHEINMVSPVKEFEQERATLFSPVVVEQDASEACSEELNEESLDTAIVKVTDPVSEADTDESSSAIAVNADDKAEGSADGVHSDDMNSEIENYMDALATMDSEMETDNEYKLKMDGALKIDEKNGTDYDANQDHMDVQGNFSDSQSIGNSSLSYDRNSSVRRGQGSFSCSDSLSQLAENTLSDSEGPMKTSSVTGSHATEIMDSPPGSSYRVLETEGRESFDHAESADVCFKAGKMPDPGATSCSSCPLDSKTAVPGPDLTITDISRVEFANSYLGNSNSQDSLVAVSSECHAMPDLDQEDQNVLLDSLIHTSFVEEVDIHNTADNIVGDEDNDEEKDLTEEKIDTQRPIMTPSNEQFSCSASSEPETVSLVTFSSEALDVVRPENLHSVVNPHIPLTYVNTRNSKLIADFSKPDEMEELERSSATIDVSQTEINSEGEVPIPHSEDEMNIQQACGFLGDKGMIGLSNEVAKNVASFEEAGLSTVQLDSKDEEEIVRITNRVNEVTGNAVPSEQTDFSELESSDHTLSNNEVAEVLEGEDTAPRAVSATDAANTRASNPASLTLDVFSPSSNGLLVVQQSLSGSKVPQEEELSQETVAPGCLAQLQALEEVKQDRTLPITNYGLHKSDSVDECPVLNENLLVTESPLSERDQDNVFDNGTSSSGQGNWDVVPETVSEIKSAENGHGVVSSSLPRVESSTELPWHRLSDQIPTSNLRTLVGANSRSLKIPVSVSSAEGSAELQPHQLREQFSEENEPQSSSELLSIPGPVSSTEHSLDFRPKQNKVHGDNDEAIRFDDPLRPSGSGLEGLPSQAPLLQFSDDKLKSLPFSFAFPNAGLQPESTSTNLEDTPPLPPLPPMQWRMGKVQPASVFLEREGVDQTPDTFSLMQPCTLPHGLTFSENESSVPSPPYPVKDSIWQQQTMSDAADGWQDGFNLVEAQLPNQFLSSSEVLDEKSEPSLLEVDQEEKQYTSNLSLIESTVPQEPTSSGCDHVSLNDFQAAQPVISEMHEAHSHNLVEEEVIVPDTSMEKLWQVEDRVTDDPMTSQGETSWSPSTLALPPAYGVGKLNGNKLPLPRNPLIDAVAAHDKSKLRKVAERVRPQLVPKLEERDTLLEQIRTKSFNLKPPSVTRPGVQAVPGPKTNLRVAAILEKANAIRQALAGSDEDEDSDSWSDS